MAEAALRLTDNSRDAKAPGAPDGRGVITPKSWESPHGDGRVEGALLAVDCLGSGARLHVRAEHRDLTLTVSDPNRVQLKNAPSATAQFTCGPQSGVRVAVEYFSATGEVTAIEFR